MGQAGASLVRLGEEIEIPQKPDREFVQRLDATVKSLQLTHGHRVKFGCLSILGRSEAEHEKLVAACPEGASMSDIVALASQTGEALRKLGRSIMEGIETRRRLDHPTKVG